MFSAQKVLDLGTKEWDDSVHESEMRLDEVDILDQVRKKGLERNFILFNDVKHSSLLTWTCPLNVKKKLLQGDCELCNFNYPWTQIASF